jgi:PAS domain S-box-containing protein
MAVEGALERVLRLTPFMLTRCGSDLRYVFVSDSYAAMLGRPAADFVGQRIVDIMGEEGFAQIRPHVERALEGHVVQYERPIHFAGVGQRELSVVYTPERDASNSVVGWVASILDVTDHKQAQRALQESEERFEMLAEGSPALLWVNGPQGCEFVNQAYLDFLGVESGVDVRGYDWSRFIHPDDRDMYVQAYRRAYEAGTFFAAEFRFLRFDGQWRWMRTEGKRRLPAIGEVRYVGATVDITDQKIAEDALRKSDQRKDVFLAVLAHELRNPLAPIRMGLELLRRVGAQPGMLEQIRPVLERQVEHMVRLIDDLLDVSRITSGKVRLDRQPTSVQDLVRHAVDATRSLLEDAGLQLSVTLPGASCLVDVDPTRFVQVLSNVLHNAIKFTPRGGAIDIHADVHTEENAPTLVLSVRDTGVGIPAETLPRIFDLFFESSQHHGAASGLGIGLALARQLLEMQGGHIEACSDGIGRGATFTIRMPVITSAAQASAGDSQEFSRLDGLRVLVVDDNEDAANVVADFVRLLGGMSEISYSGLDGLRIASVFHPAVILLDIGLPEMDGYEVCRRLRALLGKDVYIVALTGWGQHRERALQQGFDAHLTKPPDPRALATLLSERSREGLLPS